MGLTRDCFAEGGYGSDVVWNLGHHLHQPLRRKKFFSISYATEIAFLRRDQNLRRLNLNALKFLAIDFDGIINKIYRAMKAHPCKSDKAVESPNICSENRCRLSNTHQKMPPLVLANPDTTRERFSGCGVFSLNSRVDPSPGLVGKGVRLKFLSISGAKS